MKTPTKLLLMLLLLSPTMSFAAEHSQHAQAPAAASEYKYKTPKLNRAQFDALLLKPAELVVIDVRRPDELTTKGGFPVYLSIQATEIEKSVDFIPKDRSIVTVSNHAGRAGAAADLLAAKGFKVVGAVGALNYEEEGGKLTKIAPVKPKS
ncbi:MAG: rhodanese-like domain-containing protein [Methylococcales bacterium]|nr:rhodanese-like domain-containing protein [Methylococcales bacterium]